MTMQDINVDYSTTIPNNVGLTEDRRVLKALEVWHPGYLNWWNDMGPEGFQEKLVYLRTAYSVDPRGWAKFDYVRMPEYRWGVLLAPQEEDRKIPFGPHYGEPAWQEVPGEYRAMLRRLMVIQGDTEPASVEQQRHSRQDRAVALRPAQSVPGQRRGRPSPVGDGLSAAEVFRPRRPRGSGRFAAPPLGLRRMRRACSARSTRRRRTGCRSSCSPTSPTATARCSSTRWRSPASIRSRAPAVSCSPRKRTTCSWARPASAESCSAPATR